MEASGCPLNEAFGEIEDIKVKKKSKKEKRKTEHVYSDDLKPIDSRFQESSKMVQGYDNSQYYDINGPSDTYGSYQQLPHQVNTNVAPPPKVHHPIETPIHEKELVQQRNTLSDEEFKEFKDFQTRKHFENHQKRLSQLEGFSNVNDDFNDVLLFGLLGVFFLIFTDYIYKLGKKSY